MSVAFDKLIDLKLLEIIIPGTFVSDSKWISLAANIDFHGRTMFYPLSTQLV